MYLNRNKNKMNVKASFYATIILIGERAPLNHFATFLSKQCLPPLMSRSVFCRLVWQKLSDTDYGSTFCFFNAFESTTVSQT